MSDPLHLPLVLSADHPAFAGHFPGRPIVPGVVLLAACQNLIEAHNGRSVSGLIAAKFLSPVSPGEALQAELQIGEAEARFHINAGARSVASGRMRLASKAPA